MLKLSSIQWKMECKAWSNAKAIFYIVEDGRWNVKLGKMECKANAKLFSIQWKMECKAWSNVKAIFYIVEDGM